jgi:hypothetical protein
MKLISFEIDAPVASTLLPELLNAKEEPLDLSETQGLESDTTNDISYLWLDSTINLVGRPTGCSDNAQKTMLNRVIGIFGKVIVDYPTPKVTEVVLFLSQLAKRANGDFFSLLFNHRFTFTKALGKDKRIEANVLCTLLSFTKHLKKVCQIICFVESLTNLNLYNRL